MSDCWLVCEFFLTKAISYAVYYRGWCMYKVYIHLCGASYLEMFLNHLGEAHDEESHREN